MSVLSPQLSQVVGCAHQTTAKDAKLAHTHYLLGDDYLRKKMPNEAKRELFAALELDAENKDAHQLLGVIFFVEGLQKMNDLERQRCLKGKEADEQRQEANKEFRRSEDYLLKAVSLTAKKEKKIESEALTYLANISLHFKRYEQAVTRSQKALENILFTQRHLAYASMGWAYYGQGKLDEAARELRQAVFHEPKFCVGRYRLAKVHYDKKQLDQAVKELIQVTEEQKCPIQEAYQLLGLCYLKQKQPDLAQEQFEQCRKLSPESCVSEECKNYAKLM